MKITHSNKFKTAELLIIPILNGKLSKKISELLDSELLKEVKFLITALKETPSISSTISYKKKTLKILILNINDDQTLEKAIVKMSANIKSTKAESVSLLTTALNEERELKSLIQNLLQSFYKFDRYLTDKSKKQFQPKTLHLISNLKAKDLKNILSETEKIVGSLNYIKDLVNTTPTDCTPSTLANEAKKIAKSSKYIKVKIMDEKEILKQKLNLLYSVGAGSAENSKLIKLEYKKNPKNKKPILIVGKGVTFDAGGLNIKPTGHIETMKYDMGGAGAVLGLFHLLSQLNLDIHVIGLIPSVENLVGNKAYKPGDVITAYNKKTVEIINTDAEGRLILADALSYGVKNFKPESVIDLATLTGACISALGYTHTAIITNNDKLFQKIEKAAESTQKLIHRLPVIKFYQDQIEGDISDYKNYSKGIGAGTITAGTFLEKFIDETPWVHMDIAGTAFLEKPIEDKPAGATGEPLELLYTFLRDY